MANWVILSGDNIRLLDSEIVAMLNVVTLQDIDSCVLSASSFARSYVAGGGNILEPSPAVPPEVVDDVIALSRATYLAQEPSGSLLTPIRQKERDDAMAHLRDIAKGIATVTPGDIPPNGIGVGGNWGSATRIAMRTEAVPPPP
jgi:hypothetical protein